MGRYGEYLRSLDHNFVRLTDERKKMLANISRLRGDRDVLVFASDFTKSGVAPVVIDDSDFLAVQDQLEDMNGDAIDIVLETMGGYGEVVENIVDLIHCKYDQVGMLIPGHAKSAGTIFAMAGDEILMGDGSSLGPIDGQVQYNDKVFSADAFLDGFEEIKHEMEKTRKLSPVYIPMLQNISPGEIQNCKHVQAFSKHLVAKWLVKYKFKDWNEHSAGGEVTEEEKCSRAEEIAKDLGSQSKWFTHARSIKIDDLEDLGLKIGDYRKNKELNDAITRYYILLRMSFDASPVYKIFETKGSQIYRFITPVQPAPNSPSSATAGVVCPHCMHKFKVQINLKDNMELGEDVLPYPISTDAMPCPRCGVEIDMKSMRENIEAQAGVGAVK